MDGGNPSESSRINYAREECCCQGGTRGIRKASRQASSSVDGCSKLTGMQYSMVREGPSGGGEKERSGRAST